MRDTIRLRHGHIDLALHRLAEGDAGHRPLLLLHGLGERTPDALPGWLGGWIGPVYGLDFTGHGDSTVTRSGGYTAETLLGDADAALAAIGETSVIGRGLGAYTALQLAGGRPREVLGSVLADGPGLAGGGIQPGSPLVVTPQSATSAPDPFAMVELSRDVRPPDYALSFVRFALDSCPTADPILVAAVVRPEWLAAVADDPGVVECSLENAVDRLARAASPGR